jgi:predicted ester cyclase
MNIEDYFNLENNMLNFSREQASSFAKFVAGDFNPIHDVDAKKFCVPGDLLFAVSVAHFGASQNMRFNFESMVSEKTFIALPSQDLKTVGLIDQNDKPIMSIDCSGKHTSDKAFLLGLIEKYVQFSGKTFPDILMDLMQEKGVMINPARPLIIYRDMAVHILEFPNGELTLEFAGATLTAEGKKGDVKLEFDVSVDGKQIGHGIKSMVIAGLRPYDAVAADKIIADYNQTKTSGLASR